MAVFLSLGTEAFRMYTNIDPESTERRLILAMHFIIQATPDIKRKLQFEPGSKSYLSALTEEAFKVCNS